jgi:hypothetical protein
VNLILKSKTPNFKFSQVKVDAWVTQWEEELDAAEGLDSAFGAPEFTVQQVTIEVDDSVDQNAARALIMETFERDRVLNDITVLFDGEEQNGNNDDNNDDNNNNNDTNPKR